MKVCKDCNLSKPLNEFTKKSSCKDGYEIRCKKCRSIKYNKSTPELTIKKIYQSQITNSINRNHALPNYTLEELITWTLSNNSWKLIYKDWQDSNYDKWLAPSIDRIDSNKPYDFNNIQLMTWKENSSNAHNEVKRNDLQRNQRPVRALNLDGSLHKDYYSIANALEEINGSYWGISSVADGIPVKDGKGYYYQPQTYKGYKWQWI